MADSLVIVESPAKAKTINKYLGSNFVVKSSVGHIRDLPPSKLGVDIEKDFKPEYITIKGKNKVVAELKKAAKGKKNIFLAPDPDREGEAIAWHIASILDSKENKLYRVTFNEITKDAVKKAFESPSEINMNRVNAQQARRILDRIVGYQISPLLWERLTTGLSAGRVQSVALKIICDREKEIMAFQKEEYWSITAHLQTDEKIVFTAKLINKNNKKIKIGNKSESEKITNILKKTSFKVDTVKKQDKKRNPYPPFITSTLQQESARHFYYNAKKTMLLAQNLYEGIDLGKEGSTGLITYMRTDSTRVANSAIAEVRKFISNEFDKKYLPPKPKFYSSKKSAQDAHEAIRPTSVFRTPQNVKSFLSNDQYKLYSLIWKRFVASQMQSAIVAQTSIDIAAAEFTLRATGSIMKFDGFMKLYTEKSDNDDAKDNSSESNKLLPNIEKGQLLDLNKLDPKQHFTQPPPRFSEATLIKTLEENGIGRPSTYAAIMSRIQDKKYTTKIKSRFHPTELGLFVTSVLTGSFTNIMNEKFTASMENNLDEIEQGNKDWLEVLDDFYKNFDIMLKAAYKSNNFNALPTDIKCKKCGKNMIIKWGKSGGFLACSGYPECKNTLSYERSETGKITIVEIKEEVVDEKCAKCGKNMTIKSGRFGRFLACSGYPECKNTLPLNADGTKGEVQKPEIIDEKCPKCSSNLVKRKSRYGEFFACSNFPKCRYIKPKETDVKCPVESCDGTLVQRKGKRGKPFYGCNNYPKCSYTTLNPDNPEIPESD